MADIAIIGAGILGLACAQKLQRAGRQVMLIDPHGIANRASAGNAAALAFSDVLPLASRGLLFKLPGWLADPLGPLAIRPAYLPRLLPWFWRFVLAGRAGPIRRSVSAQAALMRLARAEMASLVADCGLGGMIRQDGSLELYESAAELRAAEAGWRLRAQEGIAFEHVRGARLAALQPGLSPRFVAGTFVPGWETVAEPQVFARAIADHVFAQGGTLRQQAVRRLEAAEGAVRLHLDDGQTILARQVVLAAGAWSKPLAAQAGETIPLDTERGYNTTLPPGAFPLRRQLIFGGHGFVISALSTGIRVGGAVEFAGLDHPPNFARARAMLRKAKSFLPELRTEGGREWMGHRPSLPDSLPVIGRARAMPRLVLAFGHGHLGLTQSAATGRLVADLIADRPPAIDLSAFSPERF
ncbi:NAD(P)/FAD-dependent oxidoreductase [Acidisoma sp. C75]